MIILNPSTVRFGAHAWVDVTSIIVDRTADRMVIERGDLGPHITLTDVPEQRITIRLSRQIARDEHSSPRPSDQEELVFCTAPAASDGARRRVRATCVVVSLAHELSRQRGAIQHVTLVALSSDGAADPITIEDASDGVL